MKKFLFTISFLFTLTFSGLSQADTISYWHVYLDNKLINEFSITSVNPNVEILNPTISRSSILSVDYFRDTPCPHCRTFLVISDSNENIIDKIKGSGTSQKYHLKLKRLIKIYERGKDSSFKLYFKEPPYQDQHLFTLTFKD